jgi:hypothetical protein
VASIQNERILTGRVTLHDYQNPYVLNTESEGWVKKYYDDLMNSGNSTWELKDDFEKTHPGKKINILKARLLVKQAGYRFYRTTWVQKEKYKAPPTLAELIQGAKVWLSLFSEVTWVVTFDEYEIKLDSLPYVFWAKRENYQKLMARKKDGSKFFVQAAIDLAGTAIFNVFTETISTTEKCQFLNEASRVYMNLIENEDIKDTKDNRRLLIGNKKIIFYVDRASYNTSLYLEEILSFTPYIQFAVRSTAKFNPIEFWNGYAKYFAKKEFFRGEDKEDKLKKLIRVMKSVPMETIQKYYWTCVQRALAQLGLPEYLEISEI